MPQAGRSGQGLASLLAATAQAHPARIAFIDPGDKAAWSDRRPITWTYGAAAEVVARLANGLKEWRLPPASRIGIIAAAGSETLLSYLSVEAAGHIPCLLPLPWDEDALVAGIQAAGIAAVLTQSRVAATAPAERMRGAAVRYFGLRYLAAFGPDVPDGVINLDGVVLDGRGGPFAAGSGGLVTFAAGDPSRPIHRSADAVIAAVSAHLAALRIAPGERILSLLAPSDLRGLVSGLGAALGAGTGLETLGPFDAAALSATLARPVATHLVVPAALERNLAASRCPQTLRSITVAHRAPTRLSGRLLRPDLPGPDAADACAVLDLLAFDETALVTVSRAGTDIARVLGRSAEAGPVPAFSDLRLEADGRLVFRGLACQANPLQRGNPAAVPAEIWTLSPFLVRVVDGRATEITRS